MPSASLAVGRKLYALPTLIVRTGVPEIVGARFVEPLTAIENAGSAVLTRPSLTLMMMLPKVPVAVGVPLKRPVVVLKVAQAGRFWMAKPRELPSVSAATGWK